MVLVDYVDPADTRNADYFTALRDLLEAGCRGWVAITIPAAVEVPWTARSCLMTADGAVFGDPPCSVDVLREALKTGCALNVDPDGPGWVTYVHSVGAQGSAFVFGAGHCGQKLLPLLSSLGFYCVIVDDRDEFANAARFPSADRIVVPASFEDVVPKLPIDDDSYVVILTRGHVWDRIVLGQALKTDAAYIGMIGSTQKIASIFQALRVEGASERDLARVFSPIGLDIGAETPEEIAVSIAAQLVQVRAAKRS